MNYNIIKKLTIGFFVLGDRREICEISRWYHSSAFDTGIFLNPVFHIRILCSWSEKHHYWRIFFPHFYYTHGTEFEMNKFMRLLCFIETCPQFYRLVIFLPWQYNAESAQGNVHRLVILRFSLKTSVTCYAKMGYYKYLNGFFSSNK